MSNIHQKLIQELLKNPPQNEEEILAVKRKYCKKYKIKMPNNAELLKVYREMIKNKKDAPPRKTSSRGKPGRLYRHENLLNLEKLLRKKQIRTLSGVAPIAVLTKPYKCPGNCIYCPSEKDMPKSYLSNEPAVMRAQLCDFHPFKQVALRIKALQANGHETDKLELIVMGGTWNTLPSRYKLWYIYSCFRAANNPSISLKHRSTEALKHKIKINIKLKNQGQITWNDLYREQKKNETAKHRIVGLTLETRPDQISFKRALKMREFGCTRVEIGVQHLDNKILKYNNRGHGIAETIQATKILRSLGFKITYHMMLNLPGSNLKKDYEMFKELFSNPNYQPDSIKIYPCVVTKYSKLYKLWRQGKYKPYTDQQLKNLLIKIKKIIPYYVRIIRVIRDIPEESIVAGNKITNLRDLLDVKCKCIRCREVGHQRHLSTKALKHPSTLLRAGLNTKLFVEKYKTGEYIEYFLSYESLDRKILYAFCRLRVLKNLPLLTKDASFIPPLTKGGLGGVNNWISNIPMIRELHTYGQMVPISAKIKSPARNALLRLRSDAGRAIQHKGLGKKLLKQAERITKENKFQQIAVIAGVGVREYYKKLNYKLKDSYLIKRIT